MAEEELNMKEEFLEDVTLQPKMEVMSCNMLDCPSIFPYDQVTIKEEPADDEFDVGGAEPCGGSQIKQEPEEKKEHSDAADTPMSDSVTRLPDPLTSDQTEDDEGCEIKLYSDLDDPEDVELVHGILGNCSDIEEDIEADDEIDRNLPQTQLSTRTGADEVRNDDDIEDLVTHDEEPQPEICYVIDATQATPAHDSELSTREPRMNVQLIRPRLRDMPSTSGQSDSSSESGEVLVSPNSDPSALELYFGNAPPVKWMKKSISSDEGAFSNQDIPIVTSTSVGSPLDYFRRYIPIKLLEECAYLTNLYALQKETKHFKPTNASELEQFIGLHLIMGTLPFPRVTMFYDATLKIAVFPQTMPRDRLFMLRTHLHFVDNTTIHNNNSDRFIKVRPLYDSIRSRLLELPLEENLAIDEQIIQFRDQLNVKKYVKGKPCPWGIKVFFLCGKSGMPYDFILYQGEKTEIDPEGKKLLGLGGGIVYTFAKRIWMDQSINYIMIITFLISIF